MDQDASLDTSSIWRAARLTALCLAVDGHQLGGARVIARPGPAREAWTSLLRKLAPRNAAWRRLPAHCSLDQLLGPLDLAATLKAGEKRHAQGLLAAADHGFVELTALDRLAPAVEGALGQALDHGKLASVGGELASARVTLLAFDDTGGSGETKPSTLDDRLAFRLNLDGLSYRDVDENSTGSTDGEMDPAALKVAADRVGISDDQLTSIVATALAFGVPSARAPLHTMRVARILTAITGETEADEDAVRQACALVIAPRATQLPALPEEDAEDEPPEHEAEPPPDDPEQQENRETDEENGLEDRLIEAVRAAVPADLLASLISAAASRQRGSDGQSGQWQKPAKTGRPVGLRRGDLRRDPGLDLVASMTRAAPWQAWRKRHWDKREGQSKGKRPLGILIEPDDLRFRLLKQRRGSLVIFLVDASGSAAFERLAEAKGAVELLLAQCYSRRDEAAVIAFRQSEAELLLPPTRSLTRAKRLLSGLPGGGATPLASALRAGAQLASQARDKGQSPFLVLLSDGRGNIALDGEPDRTRARHEASDWARQLASMAIPAVVIDTSAPRRGARERPAEDMARTMAARYLPLPMADARGLAAAVGQEVAAA